MARNEHDGRSLEERLASLDAMSGETAAQSPEPEAAEPPAPDDGDKEKEAPAAAPVEQAEPNAEPWLAVSPFQGSPDAFGPPPPPTPYEGGPMPQPFEGGMLPPPYAAGGTPPQPSPYDANGNAAPPFEQLPPYPSDQFGGQEAQGGYQPIDPATGQPYPQDTDDSGRPYVPLDPSAGPPPD
ncbi:hypothetical protein GWI34_23645, partial [Actinomadura sp. DSM 109109]|nr:hypothetical protein [Actinomadura lepetitiana]